jgi:hypothetical protein
VSIIKPGPVQTDIWARARKGSAEHELTPEEELLYGKLVDKVRGLEGLGVRARVLRAGFVGKGQGLGPLGRPWCVRRPRVLA